MTQAICTVNGYTLPTTGITGYNASAGSTITIALAVPGSSWGINATAADGYFSDSTVALIQATKIQNFSNNTCTFTLPNSFCAVQFTSEINNDTTTIFTFGVFVEYEGLRGFFEGEVNESNATVGVSYDINALVIKAGSVFTPFVAGGDLSGTPTDQTVIGIQTIPVSATPPTTGQLLQYNGSEYAPTTGSFFTAGGDLSGTSTDQTVIAIQGNPVLAQSLGSSQDGYVLTWNNSATKWEAEAITTGSVTLNGDVTGAATSNTINFLQGTPVSAASPTTNYLLQFNGTAWSPALLVNANVSASAAIAGTKISPNFGSQNVLTSGTLGAGATTVTSLTDSGLGTGVVHSSSAGLFSSSLIINADIAASGTANIAVNKLAAGTSAQVLMNSSAPSPTWTSISGDISLGSTGTVTVTGIDTIALSITSLATNQILQYNGTNWVNVAIPSGFTAGGDLTGTSTSQNVVDISGASGVVNIRSTGNVFTWAAATTAPGITQTSTSAGSGATMSIVAQGATGASNNGAALVLSSGSSGSATPGAVNIQYGGINAITISGAGVVALPAFSTAGIVHNAVTTGVLSSSLIVNADITAGTITNTAINSAAAIAVSKLANGTADQLLDTNHAGTATEWFTLGGDATFASHNLTVTGLQGNPVEAQSLGASQDGYVLTWHEAGPYWYAAPSSGGGGGGITALTGDVTASGSGSVAATVVTITGSAGEVNFTNTTAQARLQHTALASTSAGSGTGGEPMIFQAQSGQAATGAGHNGGVGGDIYVASGTGGTSGSATPGGYGSVRLSVNGGASGDFLFSGSSFGTAEWITATAVPLWTQVAAASTSSGNGSVGNNWTITAQAGQAATGSSHNGGNGGNLILNPGAGGTSGSATAGSTGYINYGGGCVSQISGLKTSNYTALIGDYIIGIGTLSGTITITMPSSPITGQEYIIKDVNGSCAQYNVTISPASGNIDGAASYVMKTNYQAVTVVYSGSQWSIL